MGQPTASKRLRVLLVEDNPADVILVREALREHGLDFDLNVLRDGAEALACIHRQETGEGADERPDVILLDVNLPRHDGTEVLRAIRAVPDLARVPVAMITSSDSPRDRENATRYGADCFIRKPSSLDDFLKVGGIVKDLCLNRPSA